MVNFFLFEQRAIGDCHFRFMNGILYDSTTFGVLALMARYWVRDHKDRGINISLYTPEFF